MTRYLLAALAVLAVTAGLLALHFHRDAVTSRAAAVTAAAQVRDLQGVIAVERESANKVQAIAAQYEQDKDHAQADASRLADDLRAERVRLRPVWRCPAASVPATASRAGQPDEGADDRAASAARIVRAAADADNQIRRLQDILTAERRP